MSAETEDMTDAVVRVLRGYVSIHTARSLLDVARQRSGILSGVVLASDISRLVDSMVGGLRVFLRDAAQAEACREALLQLGSVAAAPPNKLAPVGAAGGAPPESPARGATTSGLLPVVPARPLLAPRVPGAPSPVVSRAVTAPAAPVAAVAPPPVRPVVPGSVVTPPRGTGSHPEGRSVWLKSEDDLVPARAAARLVAASLSPSVAWQTRVVTVASELARNIVQYAGKGDITFLAIPAVRMVEIIAVDQGPGIPNVETVLSGSYRSRSGMGQGLRGVKSVCEEFEISTSPSTGTRIRVRVKAL